MSTSNEKLLREISIKKILNKARDSTYINPKNSRSIAYEVNNVFNRFIIGMLSFSKHVDLEDRLFIVDRRSKVDKEIVKNWLENLKIRSIPVDDADKILINIINNYNPQLDDKITIYDMTSKIPKTTLERMMKKYQNYSVEKKIKWSYKDFKILSNIVYLRYDTYQAWSQCWTVNKRNTVSYKNPKLKTIELFGAAFNTQIDTYIFGSLFPDVDSPFGGIMRYNKLIEFILEENEKGIRYNIQVAPPNVIEILNDLAEKMPILKRGNKILIMFPAWTDAQSYKDMEAMFKNKKNIFEYIDMWNGQNIKGKSIKSTLFWDDL